MDLPFLGMLAGCEYGDHSKACEKLIFPYACYKGSNADICCYTCGLYLDASRTSEFSFVCFSVSMNCSSDTLVL